MGRMIHRGPTGRTSRHTATGERWLLDSRLKKDLPKLTLCKLRPERFHGLSTEALKRAKFFLGPVTKVERASRTNPRGLAWNLIFNLIGARDPHEEFKDSKEARRIRDGYAREARRVEREIYDAQQKKGCAIAGRDIAARDYIRANPDYDPIEAARIRGRRRPKIK